jgi:hypothetical protein
MAATAAAVNRPPPAPRKEQKAMNRSLFAGLAVVGLAVGWAGVAPARAADVEKYLPNEASLVVSFNVQQILNSDLMKKYALDQIKQAMMADPQAQKTFKELGLDPLKDFSRVVIAAGAEGPEKPVILVQGKFDAKKLEAKAAEFAKDNADKLKIAKEADGTVYELVGGGGQNQTMYAAALDDTTLAASPSKAGVLDALAKAQGKKKATARKDIQELMAAADPNASAWLVLSPEALAEKMPLPNPQAKQEIEKIAAVTGSVNVTSEVKLDLNLVAKTDDAAKDMSRKMEEGLTQVKGALPLLLGQQEEMKPVIDLVNSLKLSTKDKTITLKGGLSASEIEKAIKKKN